MLTSNILLIGSIMLMVCILRKKLLLKNVKQNRSELKNLTLKNNFSDTNFDESFSVKINIYKAYEKVNSSEACSLLTELKPSDTEQLKMDSLEKFKPEQSSDLKPHTIENLPVKPSMKIQPVLTSTQVDMSSSASEFYDYITQSSNYSISRVKHGCDYSSFYTPVNEGQSYSIIEASSYNGED